MKKPCAECPWRCDVPVGTWPAERFENLSFTCRDDGRAVMACHKSVEGEDLFCVGFVVAVGCGESIGLRLAAAQGRLDPRQYGSDVPLYIDFDHMLTANGLTPPRRNKWVLDG
jgi:hypothetical protein